MPLLTRHPVKALTSSSTSSSCHELQTAQTRTTCTHVSLYCVSFLHACISSYLLIEVFSEGRLYQKCGVSHQSPPDEHAHIELQTTAFRPSARPGPVRL